MTNMDPVTPRGG